MTHFTRSPMERIPITLSPSSAGRCRTRFSVMRARHWSTVWVGVTEMTGLLMISATRVSLESLPLRQCRSLNAVRSGARAVTTISTQRTLDRAGVAAVRTARGQDEQGEFIVERFEAARQHTGTRGPCGQPEEANELERVAIADARRRDAGARGDARHDEADEVVPEGEPPHFLGDARGGLAPQGLGALEGMRLHFIEAELELPAFVVERADFGGRVGHRIEQRGEERLGAEALPPIAD